MGGLKVLELGHQKVLKCLESSNHVLMSSYEDLVYSNRRGMVGGLSYVSYTSTCR